MQMMFSSDAICTLKIWENWPSKDEIESLSINLIKEIENNLFTESNAQKNGVISIFKSNRISDIFRAFAVNL